MVNFRRVMMLPSLPAATPTIALRSRAWAAVYG